MRHFATIAIVLILGACTQESISSTPTTSAPVITEVPAGPFDLNALTEMPSITKMPEQNLTAEAIAEACMRFFSKKRYFARIAMQAPGKHEYSLMTRLMLIRAEFDTDGEVFTDPRTGHKVCIVNYHWRDTSGTDGERIITGSVFDGVMLYRHDSMAGAGFMMMPQGDELQFVVFRRPQQKGSYTAFPPVLRNWGVYRPGEI